MEPAKYLFLVYTVQLKPMIKAHSSGRMVFLVVISDVVIASVHSEKIRLKNLMMMMKIIVIIMNKSQEIMIFSGRQKLTST